MLFQLCALGSSGFIWALWILQYSPITSGTPDLQALRRMSLVDTRKAVLIIPAVVIGYVVPSVLMGLPSPTILSGDPKQIAIVLWNVYPCLVSGILFMIYRFIPPTRSSAGSPMPSLPKQLCAVRWLHGLALLCSAAFHIGICFLSFASILFPALFKDRFLGDLKPESLFLPPLVISGTSTVGDGVRSFLLWDQLCGYSTVMVVLWEQYRIASQASTGRFSFMQTAFVLLGSSVFLGPGSACILMSWWREELLFQSWEHTTETSKYHL